MRIVRQTVLEWVPRSTLVYLEATSATRRWRFEHAAADDPLKRSLPFDVAMAHPTESEVSALRGLAQLVLPTDDLKVDETVQTIVRSLGLTNDGSSRTPRNGMK